MSEAFSAVITTYAALARSNQLRQSRKTEKGERREIRKYFKFKVHRLKKRKTFTYQLSLY